MKKTIIFLTRIALCLLLVALISQLVIILFIITSNNKYLSSYLYDNYLLNAFKNALNQKETSELIKKGDIIEFGAYYNNSFESCDSLKWIVYDIDKDTVVLVSLYVIDIMPYNAVDDDLDAIVFSEGKLSETLKKYDDNDKIEWCNSSLRKWLNEDFFLTAFSDE